MRKVLGVFLLLCTWVQIFSLNVSGAFAPGNKANPVSLSLFLVDHLEETGAGGGQLLLSEIAVNKDGKFSFGINEVPARFMLYRLVMNDGAGNFSGSFGPENYLFFWAEKNSKIVLPVIKLSPQIPPVYDTLSASPENAQLLWTSHFLYRLYVKDMLDTAQKFSPQQLMAKKRYADEEARKLLKEKFSLGASLLVYAHFPLAEEAMLNKDFYTAEAERLADLHKEHVYVQELLQMTETTPVQKNPGDQGSGENSSSASFSPVIKISLAVVLFSLAIAFFVRSRKRRK